MSLTGKQIRELNSAYKSVYVKQEPVVENLAITEELFDIKDAASVMCEWNEARIACAPGYIRMYAFNASYGVESCVMSFIVNRPSSEPGFYLDRNEGPGRMISYSVKSYSVLRNAEGNRY